MSTTEQKALELADRLQQDFNSEYINWDNVIEAAAELRRLSAENEALHGEKIGLQSLRDTYLQLADDRGTEIDRLRAQVEALTGELVRKEAALIEWFDKTDWVSKTAQPSELGKHRADVLRERVEALTKPQEPVAWLAEHHAFRVSPHGQDAEGHDWLEMSDANDPKAFPVYATPSPLTRPAVPDAKAMANRLMGWKLPKNFSPDCFISFARGLAEGVGAWPVGTNLFTVDQATEMFEYVLAAVPQYEVQAEARYGYCDGTGHVHDQTGEWRGLCACEAGQAIKAQPTEAAQPTDWRAAFDVWWSENRVKTHNLSSADGFSRKAFHAGVLAAQKGGA